MQSGFPPGQVLPIQGLDCPDDLEAGKIYQDNLVGRFPMYLSFVEDSRCQSEYWDRQRCC